MKSLLGALCATAGETASVLSSLRIDNFEGEMRKFFYREWWAYVLDDSRADKDYGPFNDWLWRDDPFTGEVRRNYLARFGNYLARCLCRGRGHPAGVVWNSHGDEPDMTCNGCGEDLG